MDSKAILDYAVFHLTPTRTRCDLIIFRGKSSEKLASGLVEPFVTHLQYAKDQIPKGGYSITLRPPSSSVDDDDAPWFTKATFQRFVRFVSTPEILERIMRLEREILQIETSLQSNEVLRIEDASHQGEGSSPASNGMTKKSTNSSSTEEEEDGTVHRESSKVQLQRLMDARKALLLKEQAMAYARAVVAGYEIETIDDLICFADAFGASRLRAACADFKDLYKKKHSDDQWMDELAAVQAYPAVHDLSYMGTPGIILAGENLQSSSSPLARTGSDGSDGSKENSSTAPELSSSNAQQQMPWMNHQIPQYMYGYQMPYQGYPMPYFPGHVGFRPPKDKKKHKSSKKKSENSGDSKSSEEEEITSSDDSSSSDNDSSKGKKQSMKNKKKNKKGSKTVVIRNINYITSQKRGGERDEGASGDESSEDVSLDGDSIREGVNSAIASLERRNGQNHSHAKARKNGGRSAAKNVEGEYGENESDVNSGGKTASNPWGAFQNLLLSREDDSASNGGTKNLSLESFDEHFVAKNSNGAIPNGAKGEFHLESEKIKKHPTAADDSSAVMIRRNGTDGFRDDTLDFADGESTHPMTTRKKIVSEGENALFSQRIPESRSDGLDFSSESAGKIPRGDDWWVANNSSTNSQASNRKNQIDFNSDGDFVKKETSNVTSVTDDSFIVGSTRSGFDDPYASQWKTDITATFDKTSHGDGESPTKNGPGWAQSMEPDELTMVLVRESHESTASWAPEMDYAAEISFAEFDKKRSTAKEAAADENENGKKSAGAKKITKTPVKDARSKTLSRSRLDSLAKSKAAPASRSAMQKNKLQREEEERKRMEELVIQRQKRIAERTAASGNGLSPAASMKIASKTTPPKISKSGSMGNGTTTKSLNQSRVAG